MKSVVVLKAMKKIRRGVGDLKIRIQNLNLAVTSETCPSENFMNLRAILLHEVFLLYFFFGCKISAVQVIKAMYIS